MDLQRTSELLAGVRRGAGRTHVMLRSISALLRPGTQSRPQVVQLVPFSSSPHTSARRNHTAYRDVSCRSQYTYTTHALIDENYQEHSHARVCSALTYSVLQCPGVMPGFTGDWCKGPLSGLRLQG